MKVKWKIKGKVKGMGWLTLYQCLIGRQYEEIGRLKEIVDAEYFRHSLMNAAQTAYLNGMDLEELKQVVEKYLGEFEAQKLERICKRVAL